MHAQKASRLAYCQGVILFAVFLMGASEAAKAAAEYEVIDLGTLGGDAAEALGLNNRGQVVGWSRDAEGRKQAFLWQNGSMIGLGFHPGGTSSVARAINDAGQITGHSLLSNSNWHAFLYEDGMMRDLGTLGGADSLGTAINAHGHIAGISLLTNNVPSPLDPESFLWHDNTFIHIRPYNDFSSCNAYGLNDAGWVCGNTFLWATDGRWWGFVWADLNGNGQHDSGEMQVLGSMGAMYSIGSLSAAFDINESGQVVGFTAVSNTWFPHHAMLVTPSNGQWKIPAGSPNPSNALMRDLGTLDGPTNNSYAHAINNAGWIVGTSSTRWGTNQAFLWRNHAMTNLNSLIPPDSGWVLTNATAINEFNEIAGSGWYQGQTRAFILRQQGRIARIRPRWVTGFVVTTNDQGQITTQQTAVVEGQILEWSGLWPGASNHAFTVESSEDLLGGEWQPVSPGSQWPVYSSIWTNGTDAPVRFFRVRAE